MRAYDELVEKIRAIGILGDIAEVLDWDKETYLPKGTSEIRGTQLGILQQTILSLWQDPALKDALSRARQETLSDIEKANLREIEWDFAINTKIPRALAFELAKATSKAHDDWIRARAASDFSIFAPSLSEVVDLLRKRAAAIDSSRPAYDVLFSEYESGISWSDAKKYLESLRQGLVPLLNEIKVSGDFSFINRKVPDDVQLEFSKYVASIAGYDFTKGRLDISAHPFTAAYGRITTRFENQWTISILSTMHEKGHADYEHTLPVEHMGIPLGKALSFSVHESFSRIWENQIGRSKEFWSFLHPNLVSKYGQALDGVSVDMLYRAVNLPKQGFIRVDADELTYSLHIIVRAEIEEALINGLMEVKDIPALWNAKYKDYLGVDVPNDSQGCLQDVHWSAGLFGYFPCYALGNMMSAQIWNVMQKDIPDISAQIKDGKFAQIQHWLRVNMQQYGRRFKTKELIEQATGQPLSTEPYLNYLSQKFLPLWKS